MKEAAAGVRFLLELAALVAYGYWAVRAFPGTAGLVAGLAVPLVVAAAWAVFGSPNAPRRVSGPSRVALEATLFGGAAVALALAGRPLVAVAFAVSVVVTAAALRTGD